MILITAWVVFVFMSIWNCFGILTMVEYIGKSKHIGFFDYMFILGGFVIWFVSGLYLFGL